MSDGKYIKLNKALVILLTPALLISFYLFIRQIIFKEKIENFSNWQFPMLLAIYLDSKLI